MFYYMMNNNLYDGAMYSSCRLLLTIICVVICKNVQHDFLTMDYFAVLHFLFLFASLTCSLLLCNSNL